MLSLYLPTCKNSSPMQKIFILLACVLLSSLSLKAQDIITKKDGTAIDAKIIAVSDDIVDYKRSNYLDGPVFSISVLDIDRITYANGDVQKFENVEAQEATSRGITLGMKYSEYKNLYDHHEYIPDPRDHYYPVWSGFSSFIISGVGQIENGQTLKGIAMMVGDIGLVLTGCLVGDRVKRGNKTVIHANGGTYACWCGALAIKALSVCDAIKVAKIKNLYWRDCESLMTASSCEIKFMPDLTFLPTAGGLQPAAGMTFAIRF